MKYIFIIILLFTIGYAPYAIMSQVKLETGLPNIPSNQLTTGQELPEYINYLFIFGLGLIAVLALAQMMVGGIKYVLAAGNVATIEDAKETIKQALIGLGLLLISYLLLRTINPDLVNLRTPNLAPIEFKGEIQNGTSVDNWSKNYGGSSPTKDAEEGKPCSPSGIISMPSGLVCQNGQWTIQMLP